MASETKLNISLAIEVRIEVSAMAPQKKVPFLLPVLSLELNVSRANLSIDKSNYLLLEHFYIAKKVHVTTIISKSNV